ncbi:hypothetical protein BATDEDRAFT_89910 [Batrachochytrium dendrobatidis JAM81]|uniref:alkaline phosphatase n=1 Tax=Batrachochytrium dendrobatidis (strain JAM81 / FGSC 10211) TaxID=684364 RepID=F4P5X6_BATDJ|nr:uncharacterized protein BATDEDRAFT_89910 [Batrachochytrium dendrobatidis JAM81]EGF79255.1 hypothetical protein BATDEDRAFT_89910 [Batrachochytrium dendrobatidis JAM81]|eukprot:XP_006680076.1 hypothetical protein BATDEDRAFT_89910 [Batrachochytrium dendrobatidis JAM81]
MLLKIASATLVAALAVSAAVQGPTPGQTHRYRAAAGDSLLSLVPVDGAEFLPDQHFDISIELHNIGATATPDLSQLKATINNVPIDKFFKSSFAAAESWNFTYAVDGAARDANQMTTVTATRLALRSVAIKKSGDYVLSLKSGNQTVDATWTVRKISSRKTKNLVLFIGDGMAPSMIAAARYISKTTKFGKFGSNFLELEKLGSIGKIATNGIDAIITDSANSASAYLTGQKGWVSGLNVYADTSDDILDDPKVETLAEYIRGNRPKMCIGVVTTAAIYDATPAAMYSHTRSRYEYQSVADQMLKVIKPNNLTWTPKPVQADVLLGGGGSTFCLKTNGTACKSPVDYYALYKKFGYNVVKSKAELEKAPTTEPLLGIFTASHMDTWYDRTLRLENLKLNKKSGPDGVGSALDQPGLELMTQKAIEALSDPKRCSDGFFLMAEAASIDKAMHALDYDRGLADLLELDRTIKATKDWALKHGDNTAIIATADHSQAFDTYGTVDTKYLNALPDDDTNILGAGKDAGIQFQKHLAIGEYDTAGWIDSVMDENDMPTKWQGRYRLATGKVDGPQSVENWQIRDIPGLGTNPLSRQAVVENTVLKSKFNITSRESIYQASPAEPSGIKKSGMNPPTDSQSVHSLQTVDVYCHGPSNWRQHCAKVMDNTELFFIMAEALGLGFRSTYRNN